MITQSITALKNLSANELLTFGLNDVAYLKPANVNGQSVYAIHLLSGDHVGICARLSVSCNFSLPSILQRHK